jgi:hypothetical protein
LTQARTTRTLLVRLYCRSLTRTRACCVRSRRDAGDFDVSSAPMCISELLSDVVGMAQVGLAQQTGTAIVLEPSALPLTILVRAQCLRFAQRGAALLTSRCVGGAPQSSKEHLGHLLLNLLVFCVQASDGSPVAVHARCDTARKRGKRHSPAQKLVLEVAVQGLVLSADDLAAVFNPYEDTVTDKEDCWLRLNSTHVRLPPVLAPAFFIRCVFADA